MKFLSRKSVKALNINILQLSIIAGKATAGLGNRASVVIVVRTEHSPTFPQSRACLSCFTMVKAKLLFTLSVVLL